MVAVSRFVEFSVTGQTLISVSSAEAAGAEDAQGTRGFSRGTGLSAGVDSFSVILNSNDQLQVDINSVGPETITLASGTDLDPRFVARDIEFKLHSANSADDYKFAQCNWRNGGGGPNGHVFREAQHDRPHRPSRQADDPADQMFRAVIFLQGEFPPRYLAR